jgi:hypothetical protein
MLGGKSASQIAVWVSCEYGALRFLLFLTYSRASARQIDVSLKGYQAMKRWEFLKMLFAGLAMAAPLSAYFVHAVAQYLHVETYELNVSPDY